MTELTKLRESASALGIKNYFSASEAILEKAIIVAEILDDVVERNDHRTYMCIEAEVGDLSISSIIIKNEEQLDKIIEMATKEEDSAVKDCEKKIAPGDKGVRGVSVEGSITQPVIEKQEAEDESIDTGALQLTPEGVKRFRSMPETPAQVSDDAETNNPGTKESKSSKTVQGLVSERKTTTSEKIRTMLKEGKKPRDISKELGCRPQQVYNIRSKLS